MKFDFSGYATKNDLECSDGRTILKDAFKHNDGQTVPLVWQHLHNDPNNILGHAVLENRSDGVYAYATFNDTEAGKNAKQLVKHGDITALSIFANQLKQKGGSVLHGAIREVSLVLTGANPGAFIDNINFAHADGSYDIDDSEAVIYTGETITLSEEESVEHSEKGEKDLKKEDLKNDELKHADGEKTIKEVFDSLTEEQKNVVYFMIGQAIEDAGGEMAQSGIGGEEMKKNVFENEEITTGGTLTHAQFAEIVADAQKSGSLKESFLAHAETYGIDPIDTLFPDAQLVADPSYIQREMGWVAGVLAAAKHSPFARIKSMAFDITADEARALGYVTGNLKKEEVIQALKRITTPTTIYKKQKLDRDDIVDITDFDVVSILKAEMRVMLDEEIARAVLVGDGRDAESADKINELNIRPIFSDNDMYAHHVALANGTTPAAFIDSVLTNREFYKGSGNPTMYTTTSYLTAMLLLKDTLGRRLYNTKAELASALMVKDIVEVPVLAGVTRVSGEDTLALKAIVVNLNDYTIGADKGGAVSMFDDFDIDYNQFKYLMETRISGALYKPKSALVFEELPEVAG